MGNESCKLPVSRKIQVRGRRQSIRFLTFAAIYIYAAARLSCSPQVSAVMPP